jgi:subtilase family serine protease
LLAAVIGMTPAQAQAVQRSGVPTMADCLNRFHRICLAPAQIYAAYGIDAVLRSGSKGQGRTIAIIDSFGSPTLRADLHAFDAAFGLPDPRLTILAPLGDVHPRRSGWAAETTLDVEWAHAIAPAARIVLLESPVAETEGAQGLPEFLTLERYALQQHLADVISQSWGATEDTLGNAAGRRIVAQFHQFYADATARGVTLVAGSGDEGAAGIDTSLTHVFPGRAVGYPASDPLVLAVGGTRLTVSAGGHIEGETAWAGSGGGISKLFAEPAYQRMLPAPVQRLLAGKRGLPDVAYNAAGASPVLIYLSGKWTVAAGTSAAAPQWAGLVALADSMAGRDLGLITPALYHIAQSPRYAVDLRDITTGHSVGPIQGGRHLGGVGFRATPGWDAVTGLGSPRAAALIPDLIRFDTAQ